MLLKIYCGIKVEDLAEKLAGDLNTERTAKRPFKLLNIAVANLNLGN